MHKGYWSIVWNKAPVSEFMQTTYMYRFFFFDILAMMLIGMAFLKNGIFKAEQSNPYYGMMILIGYSIGLTTNFLAAKHIMSNEFSILSFSLTDISGELGRVFTTVGHIGVIMLFIKSGILQWLQRALASVGQMAFSNYIMQSLICNFIFLRFGLSLFGELQRYQLYFIVGSIWIVQLILSPLWLKYFHFGPLEWGWRSLTYWKKQSFRKTNAWSVWLILEK